MELTSGYIKNKDVDVCVFFQSSLFHEDAREEKALKSGFHGEQLSHWLRNQLLSLGYDVCEPSPGSFSWKFVYVNCVSEWEVRCENTSLDSTDEWKIIVNSRSKDAALQGGVPPQNCLDFLEAIRGLLHEEPGISYIDWNLAALNTS